MHINIYCIYNTAAAAGICLSHSFVRGLKCICAGANGKTNLLVNTAGCCRNCYYCIYAPKNWRANSHFHMALMHNNVVLAGRHLFADAQIPLLLTAHSFHRLFLYTIYFFFFLLCCSMLYLLFTLLVRMVFTNGSQRGQEKNVVGIQNRWGTAFLWYLYYI